MIDIKKANDSDVEVLALLGRISYSESHGQYIENEADILDYMDKAFSVSKVKEELGDQDCIFYIIYVDKLPVGYAKLVHNKGHESLKGMKAIRLERIYILADFIPHRIGQGFLDYLIGEAKEFGMESIWLSVYVENDRAIRFYERNDFVKVGNTMFLLSGKEYDNFVLEKALQ